MVFNGKTTIVVNLGVKTLIKAKGLASLLLSVRRHGIFNEQKTKGCSRDIF